MEVSDRLRNLDLFADLGDGALRELSAAATVVQLDAQDVLMRQGERADCLFIVLSGRLSVSIAAEGAPDQQVSEIEAGGVAGEIGLLAGGTRSATVRALEKSELLRVSREALEGRLDSHPDALERLIDGVRRRLNLNQVALHLGRLMGTVDPRALAKFEHKIDWVHLRSGETLCEQGEAGDSAFIVMTGRLRVVVQRGDETRVVNELGRGEMVGEMALLDGSPRVATVYAVRDTHLAKLSESAFSELTEKHPLAAKNIAKSLVARLRLELTRTSAPDSAITTIAVVPASRAVAVSALTARLAESLAAHGSTCHLGARDVDGALDKAGIADAPRDDPAGMRLAQWLEEQEAGHRFVLYEGDARHKGWTDRAIGRADHVLILADADADPAPGETEGRLASRWPPGRAPRRSLVLVHADANAEPRGTARWLAQRTVDAHYHVRSSLDADFDRLARILSGRAVGLVFGGGGARGFAHLGVWRALEEAGVPVDFVGGTSIGSIIAAGYAMGLRSAEALALCKKHFSWILDPTFPLVSLLAGRRAGAKIEAFFGDREIEDFRIPYFCVSTNLTTARETIHSSGVAAHSMRASISIPGVLPPVVEDGDLLVDGGLVNNVPVDVMERVCMRGPVIAVEVTPEVDLGKYYQIPPALSGWKVLWERINPLGKAALVPDIVTILARSTVVASTLMSRGRPPSGPHTLRLALPVADWGMFEFGSVEPLAERGYEASIEPIREWWAGVGNA